ncbi:MAG TPA: DNA polymerase Y family protein [Kofleriaceae bacterium]|nr:DNA polymerase Y family protein [Kofleriaceae bacterium]
MERIACAFIARYELMLHARAEPALLARPVAVADLAGPGRLGAVSPAAEAIGVVSGQLTASARARCPELDVLAPDPAMVAEAERDILTALGALSPRLDSDGRGGFFLGLAGLDRVIGSERALATRVREVLGGLRLPAQVAIADRPLTAYLAARRARPVRVVPPGDDMAVLAGVPLADLPVGGPGLELLELLGLGDAAAVAALPAGELARRLGAEGASLERLLSGARPVASPREEMVPPEPEGAALELDVPVDDLEPLLFFGKSLVDRVITGLVAARRALAELTIEARLDDRTLVTHVLRPAEPTMESRPVMDLVRMWLERQPFSSPVAALAVVATRVARPTGRQLSLFQQREEREAAALGSAVARLQASFGPACAVRPVLVDTYRPEARVGWEVFEVPGAGAAARAARACTCAGPCTCARASAGAMVVRVLAEPEAIEWVGGRVRRGQASARVIDGEGPYRVCGEWWERWFDRSYFWLTVDSGALWWVFRDERDGRHYLHGIAD